MAPRKKETVQVTKSAEAIVNETATAIWQQFYTPDETDAEKNAAGFKRGSDMLQKLFDALRERRDASKPVQRERRDTTATLTESLGKPLGDLQASYVHITIGTAKNGEAMLERVSLPKLRMYAETEGHPMHQSALDFMNENKVRFIEREGAAKGKKVAIFEKIPARGGGKAKEANA